MADVPVVVPVDGLAPPQVVETIGLPPAQLMPGGALPAASPPPPPPVASSDPVAAAAAAAASAATLRAVHHGGRKRGATNYKEWEVELLLLSFEAVLPRGGQNGPEWAQVAEVYERLRAALSARGVDGLYYKRSAESLWRKFSRLTPGVAKGGRDGPVELIDVGAGPPRAGDRERSELVFERAARLRQRVMKKQASARPHPPVPGLPDGAPGAASDKEVDGAAPGGVAGASGDDGAGGAAGAARPLSDEALQSLLTRAVGAINEARLARKRAAEEAAAVAASSPAVAGEPDAPAVHVPKKRRLPTRAEREAELHRVLQNVSHSQEQLAAAVARQGEMLAGLAAMTEKLCAIVEGRGGAGVADKGQPPPPQEQQQQQQH